MLYGYCRVPGLRQIFAQVMTARPFMFVSFLIVWVCLRCIVWDVFSLLQAALGAPISNFEHKVKELSLHLPMIVFVSSWFFLGHSPTHSVFACVNTCLQISASLVAWSYISVRLWVFACGTQLWRVFFEADCVSSWVFPEAQETHKGCRVSKAQFPDGEKVFSPRPHEVVRI